MPTNCVLRSWKGQMDWHQYDTILQNNELTLITEEDVTGIRAPQQAQFTKHSQDTLPLAFPLFPFGHRLFR